MHRDEMIMTSPAAALAWEIWRKNRFGFLLLFVFLIVCLALGRLATHFAAEVETLQLSSALPVAAPEIIEANARAMDWAGQARWWSGVLLGLALLVTLAMFAFAESSSLRGFSGIPFRLFTLPVRTTQLVAVPMASGACFVALLYLAWSGWCSRRFSSRMCNCPTVISCYCCPRPWRCFRRSFGH